MHGLEQSQTEVMMNIAEGYLEMLRGDLQDARADGDLELVSEIEEVVTQLEDVSRAREEINYGIEQVLSSGGEGRLNAEIHSINTEFMRERNEYLNNIVNTEHHLDFVEENNMVVTHGDESIDSVRIIIFVTGMMLYCFSEQD